MKDGIPPAGKLSREDKIRLLGATDPRTVEMIRRAAHDVLLSRCGKNVYYRGLIEISNICSRDCLYCGIRRSNSKVKRYELAIEDIVEKARWCAAQGYGSLVLQSGERSDENFVNLVAEAVRRIKSATTGGKLPRGLGITLCVGEQTRESYQKFFDAGAHRYLLRIETSNQELFSKIHPPGQKLESRLNCLKLLREIGFQVGTGVMIGLPGQTTEHLADDLEFFVRQDIDMIGMGPFIPNEDTPLWDSPRPDEKRRILLSLLMIALARLSMPDINIASTTALRAMDVEGQEKGLLFGANVIMPVLTPVTVRGDYLLYPGKPFLCEENGLALLEKKISEAGRTIGFDEWGDSLHALKRRT